MMMLLVSATGAGQEAMMLQVQQCSERQSNMGVAPVAGTRSGSTLQNCVSVPRYSSIVQTWPVDRSESPSLIFGMLAAQCCMSPSEVTL